MKNRKLLVVMSMMLVFSVSGIAVVSAAECYQAWYQYTACPNCDDSLYNTSQTDACLKKHPRQNGIKLCSTHLKAVSTNASYYKRGFSDYNCLAYALGKNGVQSWTWPSSWGSTGPTCCNPFKVGSMLLV